MLWVETGFVTLTLALLKIHCYRQLLLAWSHKLRVIWTGVLVPAILCAIQWKTLLNNLKLKPIILVNWPKVILSKGHRGDCHLYIKFKNFRWKNSGVFCAGVVPPQLRLVQLTKWGVGRNSLNPMHLSLLWSSDFFGAHSTVWASFVVDASILAISLNYRGNRCHTLDFVAKVKILNEIKKADLLCNNSNAVLVPFV